MAAIVALDVPQSIAWARAYLASGADRQPLVQQLALTACRVGNDPHNQEIAQCLLEDYAKNRGFDRDRLLLACVQHTAGHRKYGDFLECGRRYGKAMGVAGSVNSDPAACPEPDGGATADAVVPVLVARCRIVSAPRVRSRSTHVSSTSSARRPTSVGEDLDLGAACVAGGLHETSHLLQLDDAVAHHAAVVEQVARRHQPVADVIGEQPVAAGARDLRSSLGSHHTWYTSSATPERTAAAGLERVADVERLLQRVDAGALRRLHGMQRLDGERQPTARHIPATPAMPSRTWARAKADVRCDGLPASAPGSAPTTSTRQDAPSVLASSTARRLSSSAARRPARIRRRIESAATVARERDAGVLRSGRAGARGPRPAPGRARGGWRACRGERRPR